MYYFPEGKGKRSVMIFREFDPFDLNRDGAVDGIDCMIFNEINKTEEEDDEEDNDDRS